MMSSANAQQSFVPVGGLFPAKHLLPIADFKNLAAFGEDPANLTFCSAFDYKHLMTDRDVKPIIVVPDEGQLGAAMNALASDRQRAFVIACLEFGDLNFTRAAIAAGYGGGHEGSVRNAAWRLSHDPAIQAAMDEEARRRLNSGKLMAVSTLLTMAHSAAKDSDKLKALEMVLNRTGMPNQSEHKVIVSDVSKTDEEMIARITQLANKLGMDPQKLLGGPPPVEVKTIDAEFIEVKPEEEW